jgi:hypothetical protein
MSRGPARSVRFALALAGSVVATVFLWQSRIGAEQPTPQPTVQAQAGADTLETTVVTDTGTQPSQRVDSRLDKLERIDRVSRSLTGRRIDSTSALPDDLRGAVQDRTLALDTGGRVQVYVRTLGDPAPVAAAVEALGAEVQRVSAEYKIVQAMLPISAIADAANLPDVGSIRPPERPALDIGSRMTQGDAILLANQLRSTYSVDGTGVKVGILSDGGEGLADSQALGDLPPGVDTTTCDMIESAPGGEPADTTSPGAGGEGTAMAEIVHDMAPGAQLMIGYFGINVSTSTSLDFNDAVNCLSQNNDVVVDDIAYFNSGLYDGTSDVSQNKSNALNNPANPIRGYYTSNGNYATAHYQEPYVSAGFDINGAGADFWRLQRYMATGTTGDNGLRLSCAAGVYCGDQFQLAPGGSISVFLQWNDPWGNSTNNYDLLLYDPTAAQIYLMSAFVQNGAGSDPVEAFGFANPYGVQSAFYIMIGNYRALAAARTFDMFIGCSGCATYPDGARHNFNTRSSSVPNSSDAGGGVMSLGAIDQADPGNDTAESFSSIGPTNDGRTKPDAAAIDGVDVTGVGGFVTSFFGTSAAAPHAAAVAALVLSCNPTLKDAGPADNAATDAAERTAVRNAILNTAVDLGAAGNDNVFGRGRIDALAAAGAAGCTTDVDSDGVSNSADNCVYNANPGQENSDGNFLDQTPPALQDDYTWANSDAAGNACDTDDDNDGILDTDEPAGCAGSGPLSPTNRDTDGDRYIDSAECAIGTNPASAASRPTPAMCASYLGVTQITDSDGDGLRNFIEFCGYNTDPNDTDTDDEVEGAPPGLTKDGCEAASFNGDRLVTAADQFLMAYEMTRELSPALRLANMDINKDTVVTSGDQLILAKFISPPGQCP